MKHLLNLGQFRVTHDLLLIFHFDIANHQSCANEARGQRTAESLELDGRVGVRSIQASTRCSCSFERFLRCCPINVPGFG